MKKLIVFSSLGFALSAAASQLPFVETFESPVTNGAINGQNGWVGTGTANVQSSVVGTGSQALQVTSGSATHALTNTSDSVWVGFQARITAAPSAAPTVTNANTSVALFVNTNRNLVVFNGTNAVELAFQMETNVWTRFDVFCDYAAKKWLLSVNGTNVLTTTEPIDFYSTSSHMESLLIANDTAASVYIDELAVQETELTLAVADSDADGLADWWEYLLAGNFTDVPAEEIGANGLTYLQCYLAGLSTTDAQDVFALTRTAKYSFNWTSKPSRQYNVFWTSNLVAGFTQIQAATEGTFTDTDEVRTQAPAGFYQVRVSR